ncbi:MAG: hypothetical protein DRR19_13110 [Candidatus Parabeggiatoa sp. nov. 1]|nr:MAG: hypothetical protein DRR19_13110 [Gammaproteobacteria bacterium]
MNETEQNTHSTKKWDCLETLSGLSNLPSDAEKQHIFDSLEVLIQYFKDLQNHINSLPNDEERNKIASATTIIKKFVESAKENPTNALILGLSSEDKKKEIDWWENNFTKET